MKHIRSISMVAKAETWPADHPDAVQSVLGLLFDPVRFLKDHLTYAKNHLAG